MEGRRADKREREMKNDYLDDILTEEEQDLGFARKESSHYTNTDRKSVKPKLQLQISVKVIVPSDKTNSGKRYVWERSGDILEVEMEDLELLLNKRLGDKACCGGNSDGMKLFVRVE